MSRYFNWPTSLKRLVRFSAARAEDVNDALDDLSAGMDTLDADVDRAIKLPVGAGNQVLNLAPGVRANKVLAFDASGNVSVSVNDVDSSAASASAAQSSANAAAASAATAGTQGGIATTKAGEAAASASAAASSATAASASQSAALTSQNSAATSASTATAQASAASASASAAAASQSAAAGSATAASTSASNAAASQSAAATSATNAANSATAASTSATNAASSASSASTSATNASKLNLGAKASAPTLDNQGQPLQAGASYYDTTMAKWRVWSGSIWIDGYPGSNVYSVAGKYGHVAVDKWDLTPIAAATFSYTNNLVTGMSEDGVTTTIAYNAQNQVSTVTYQRGANTLVETYTYSNGKVVSMSSTGSLGTGAGGGGGGGGGGSGGPAVWGNITGTLADQPDLALALAAKANTATLAPVATSGAYADLTGTPMLGTAAAANLGDFAPTVHAHLAASIADSTATGRALLTAADATAARSTLGLGSAAQSAASSFATSAQGGKADTALQPGAGLSAIDSAAATKLAGVQAGAQVNAVSSVAGKTGAVTLAAGDISGLGAMATKSAVAVGDVTATGTPSGTTYLRGDGSWSVPPAGGGGGSSAWGAISGTLSDQTDLQTALNAKANTAALAAVATAGTYASLTGKPTLGTAAASNVGDFATAAQGVKADSAVQPADLAPYAKTADLPAVPTKTSQLTNDSGFVSDISGKVDKVAGKGLSTEDYTSAEKTKLAGIATGATANATDTQLRDRATHTGTQAIATVTGLSAAIAAKQDTLVSGSSIKTVNGQSLLGGGDLVIAGGGGGASACAIPLDGWFGMVLPARPGQSGSYSYATIGVGSALLQGAGSTLATPSLNSSSLLAATPRISLTSAAAANSGVDFGLSGLSLMRGASPGHGGFVIKTAFAVTSAVATQRFWLATSTYGGSFTYTQALPASGNVIGIGFDAALHSNYQLMHGGGGALTYVDLGSNFPISNTSAIIDVEFRCPPNGSSITYLVRDRNSGLSAAGTFASNLPTGSTVMLLRSFITNGGTAAAVSYDLLPVYYSSYWSA